MESGPPAGALAGLRVVELAGFGPGPMAGMMLCDQGAEVIRIERTGAHDHGFEIEPRFFVYNRGKRSVAIDLKQREGLEIVLSLIDRADIVIEGFRPGVAERLGFGPETCQRRNPGLIYGRITGYGQSGPLAQRAGHDLNYTALAGVISLIGPAEGPPVMPLNLVSDFGGGAMYLAFGILAALHERSRSGQGQVIDAAMVEGSLSLLSSTFGYLASGFHSLDRGTNLLDGGVPYYGIFETADGKYVSIGALEPQFFARLVAALGLDPAWIDSRRDRARWPELRRTLEDALLRHDRAHWELALSDIDVCFAPVPLARGSGTASPFRRPRQRRRHRRCDAAGTPRRGSTEHRLVRSDRSHRQAPIVRKCWSSWVMTRIVSPICARAVSSAVGERAPRIVGIGGTARPGSSTEQALTIAVDAAKHAGADTQIFGGDVLLSLPHYRGDPIDCDSPAAALLAAVRGADGLIMASPGYHGSVSGLFKNAVDYLEETAGDPRAYLHGPAGRPNRDGLWVAGDRQHLVGHARDCSFATRLANAVRRRDQQLPADCFAVASAATTRSASSWTSSARRSSNSRG